MTTLQNKKVIVIGHKNPDTDSICSAIAYADLKNKTTDMLHTPMRAGQIPMETQFVLNHFEIPFPNYISDVSSQISDIDIKQLSGISGGLSLRKAWAAMREKGSSTLPVLDGEKLLGLISIRDIATSDMDTLDNRILSKARTSYSNIVQTLDGMLVTGDPNGIFSSGKVLIAAANPDLLETFIEKGDMVLLGDRYDSQLCALEMGAGCLIVCVDAPVTKTIQRLAEKSGCTIISTPYDTYTVARLINQSMPVEYFMTPAEKLITFRTDAFTDDVKQQMSQVRFRDFPVVDKQGNYKGMISRRFLLWLEKKKVILVDHNEKSQAVDGITEAEIIEIIDHHRIGTLETIDPVYFRNQPLGCTATIIYQMYCEQQVEIEPAVAGLLCAAIISDTLFFRSPTSTPADKAAAKALAPLAGIELESFAMEMFTAGSNFDSRTAEELFYQDYKKFISSGKTFGVGQLSAMTEEQLSSLEQKLLPFMEETFSKHNVDMMFLMLTNILTETSKLIFIGDMAREIVSDAFDANPEGNSITLEGVVSRKKQLIPTLMGALQQQ